jgi:hypothetical protein
MFRWVAVVLIAWTGSAFAQTSANTTYCTAKAAQSPAPCGTIEIVSGHSSILKLDRPFSTLVLGDDNLVKVNAIGDRAVVITAKIKDGKTNLMFLDKANEPMYSAEVVVTTPPDNAALGRVRIFAQKRLADYIPYACTSEDCIRLKAEYQGELSKDLYVPGLPPPPPQINIGPQNFGGASSGGGAGGASSGGGATQTTE